MNYNLKEEKKDYEVARCKQRKKSSLQQLQEKELRKQKKKKQVRNRKK